VLGNRCRSVVLFFNDLSVDSLVRNYSMVQLCLRWMLGSFVVIDHCYFILGIIMYGVLCSGGCGICNVRIGWQVVSSDFCLRILYIVIKL
jgi:hypothetical protein